MDFLTTARMLMDLQQQHPDLRYSFEHTPYSGTTVVIRLEVDDSVPQMFENATKMFEPA